MYYSIPGRSAPKIVGDPITSRAKYHAHRSIWPRSLSRASPKTIGRSNLTCHAPSFQARLWARSANVTLTAQSHHGCQRSANA